MNRSNTGFRILSAALALALGAGLYAQSTDTGSIKGRVTDEKGQPLPGAVVKARGAQGTKGAETDGAGNYAIPFLTPGTYEVTVTMDGFNTVVQSGVGVAPLSVAQQAFKLQAGGEVIKVSASAVHIDPTSTTTKTTINLADAVKTFAQGNSLTSAFDFAPGTNSASGLGNGNPSISGASGFENQYLIGGVNVTSSGYGAFGAYDRFSGITGNGMTTEFLGDLTIREGGFEAEYGQALGGVISASVKSGTNEYHGAVTAYYTPRSLNGARRDLSQYYPAGATDDHGANILDAAVSFGGPIIKDKLFFFVGYNPVWNQRNFEYVVADPSTLSNDGIVGGAPYVNNEFSAAKVRSDNYSLHLTWNLTEKHKLDFLFFGSPQTSNGIQVGVGTRVDAGSDPGVATSSVSPQPLGTIPNVGATEGASGTAKGSDVAYSLKYFGTLAPWMNLEAQVSFHRIKTSLEPDYAGPLIQDIRRSQYVAAANSVGIPTVMSSNNYILGGQGGYSTGTTDRNLTYSLKATNTFNAAGAHELKYGFEYADIKYNEANQFAAPVTLGGYNITSGFGAVTMRCAVPGSQGGVGSANPNATGINDVCTGPLNGVDYTRYRSTRTRLNPIGLETINQETNIFLQDKWTIVPSLTLSLGARYTSEKVGNPNDFTVTLAGTPRALYGTTYKFPSEIAPRFGITWDVLNNSKSKLYASFGRMYERIPNDLAIRSFGNEVSLSRLTATVPDFSNAAVAPGGIFTPTCVAGSHLDSTRDAANYRTFGDTCGGTGTKETRLPYKDEVILGYQFQLTPTVQVELAGMYRKQGRLLEDTQPVTAEATTNYYAGYTYRGYFNYSYVLGDCTTAGCPTTNFPGSAIPMPFPTAGSSPFGGYVLANVGENAPTFFYDYQWDPTCSTDGGPTYGPNGCLVRTNNKITVGYGNPENKYKSLSLTVIKQKDVGGHFSALVTYRIAKLTGNYEGLYRNDNGQTDPNISSLYDFPNSPLMAGQFISGPLNTEVPNSLRVRMGYDDLLIKNFSAAVTFKWESGIPRTPYLAHPNFAYNNAGEVPGRDPVYFPYSFGNIVSTYTPVQRGFAGRTPDVATWDVKFSYDWNLGKSALNFSVLVNNLFNNNAVTRWNQNVENSAGVTNVNYGLPTATAGYRTIRLGAKWSF